MTQEPIAHTDSFVQHMSFDSSSYELCLSLLDSYFASYWQQCIDRRLYSASLEEGTRRLRAVRRGDLLPCPAAARRNGAAFLTRRVPEPIVEDVLLQWDLSPDQSHSFEGI